MNKLLNDILDQVKSRMARSEEATHTPMRRAISDLAKSLQPDERRQVSDMGQLRNALYAD